MLHPAAEDEMGISTEVITSIADATDRNPADLPALYDAVDPDALDRLVASLDETATVEFRYAGFRVTITRRGVTVTPESNYRRSDSVGLSLGTVPSVPVSSKSATFWSSPYA